MKRIFTDRGMGKTTALLEYAKGVSSVLAKNGHKVYFVTSGPAASEFERTYKDIAPLKFMSYNEFIYKKLTSSGYFDRNDEIIIDEAEEFMRMFGVNAYSLTIGGSYYENY